MSFEIAVTVPADHPALPGHFPGDPLVPGVVILDHVEQALARWQGAGRLNELPSVKFLSPLRPGEPLTIRLEAVRPGRFRFLCSSGSRPVAEGQLAWESTR